MQNIQLLLTEHENYFVSESFRTLRTNLQFCGNEYKVINVTSCDANEGKTTISLMLAKALADINKKVIYVDSDMRKSVVATVYTNGKGAKGLSEYLAGLTTKEEIICSTQYDNLHVILSGPHCSKPVEMIIGDKFTGLINSLREEYDYIIVDTPPLGLVIDSAVVAKQCDGAVMVISAGKVRINQAKNTINQLEKSGCKILGAVLNFCGKRGNSYYKKYYKKTYGKGYYTDYYSEVNL